MDVPVVATGHQAAFWHPGVVAKLIVAQRLAAAVGGACVHIVVEQDVEPVARIHLPVRTAGLPVRTAGLPVRTADLPVRTADLPVRTAGLPVRTAGLPVRTAGLPVRTAGEFGGELRERIVDLLEQPEGPVVGVVPALVPIDGLPEDSSVLALPRADDAVARAIAALARRRTEPNVAMQVTRAAFDLLEPMVSAMALIGSSELLHTSLGRAVLAEIARDPEACARTYNAALDPSERAASLLRIERDRAEVPLWRLDQDGRRLRAWDDDLERFAAGEVRLMPRALLMTALLRLGVCDLFIHGLGGGTYDHAMERWIRGWLGIEVAPMAVATATLTLPLLAPDLEHAPTLATALAAQRRVHFDPAAEAGSAGVVRSVTGGAGPSLAKRAALARIAMLPRGSSERRAAWRAMHEELAEARKAHAASLRLADESLERARRASRERPIANSRLWPFFLYEPEQFAQAFQAFDSA